MKIDKTNPKHLFILAYSLFWVLLLLPFRFIAKPFTRRQTKRVVLYGHKLNGNLKSFYDFVQDNKRDDVSCYYLTLDRLYYKKLDREGYKALFGLAISDIIKVVFADAIITDHGLHSFRPLKITSIKFIDVWHGIPYKGFPKSNFHKKYNYDQIWVSSPTLRQKYVNQYGFSPKIVKATGYGRVDSLVNGDFDEKKLLEKYQLGNEKKILFAPTWKQDDQNRSIVPFDKSVNEFFEALNQAAEDLDSTLIFRAHLNSKVEASISDLGSIVIRPFAKYPVTEELLYLSSVLITDWSSIAFDFLPLDRPTIFLDVKAPFDAGFTLGPEYRFGDVVGNFEQLLNAIEQNINNPGEYLTRNKEKIDKAKSAAYGSTLDGRSNQRYFSQLAKLLEAKTII